MKKYITSLIILAALMAGCGSTPETFKAVKEFTPSSMSGHYDTLQDNVVISTTDFNIVITYSGVNNANTLYSYVPTDGSEVQHTVFKSAYSYMFVNNLYSDVSIYQDIATMHIQDEFTSITVHGQTDVGLIEWRVSNPDQTTTSIKFYYD